MNLEVPIARIFVTCLLFGAINITSSVLQANQCISIFFNSYDTKQLEYSDKSAFFQTVFNLEKNYYNSKIKAPVIVPDSIILFKPHYYFWESVHILKPGAYTKQYDVRSPLFFFGDELSQLLDFLIFSDEKGSYVYAPNAEKLYQLIIYINTKLKSKGLDTIAYLPQRAGFLTAQQAFDLALNASHDILLRFPYADKDPDLVIHEIAYHLNAILYPKKFLMKAYQINLITQNFIFYLEYRLKELGAISTSISSQLIHERSYELDAGTADLPSILASVRATKKIGQNYADILSNLKLEQPSDITNLAKNLDGFLYPTLSPLEALVARLYNMTSNKIDVDLSLKAKIQPYVEAMHDHESLGFGKKIELTKKELVALNRILKDFVKLNQNSFQDFKPETNTELLFEFLGGLDQRIQDIIDVLK